MTDGDRSGHRDELEILRRWQLAGGTWQIVGESAIGLTVSLRTCATDEEMDPFTTTDPKVVAYVRTGGDEPGAPP